MTETPALRPIASVVDCWPGHVGCVRYNGVAFPVCTCGMSPETLALFVIECRRRVDSGEVKRP